MQEQGPRRTAVATLRSFPRAFIIRPFGEKQVGPDGTKIDFQQVEEKLIRPAMQRAEVVGATTEVYLHSGPIQRDMFQRLVTAQLVIADISIHNANVYYELGIRHALRDKHTFLIRGEVAGHDMPFDIRAERYLVYDVKDPAQKVDELAAGLKATLRRSDHDSPVFSFVPELASQDPSRFIVAPEEFVRQIERAEARKRPGDIQFLAEEVAREDWGLQALRLAGYAHVRLKAWALAARIWEQIRATRREDVDADLQLGAIYQHLRNYSESRQALGRLRELGTLAPGTLARTNALLGENAVRRWVEVWKDVAPPARGSVALKSPFLREAYSSFVEAFEADLHDIRHGVNALLMGTIILRLADKFPDVWADLDFDDDEEPIRVRQQIEEDVRGLPTSIELGARTAPRRELSGQFEPNTTRWCRAELKALTADKLGRVADAYRKVANVSDPGLIGRLRERLQLLLDLDVLTEGAQQALDALGPPDISAPQPSVPETVIVFMGMHADELKVNDNADFEERIAKALADIGSAQGLIAFAGASPLEIIFHEACETARIPSAICVSHDTADFRQAGTNAWGAEWEKEFNRVSQRVRVETLQDGSAPPSWVTAERGDRRRMNRWMVHYALQFGCPVVLILPSDSPPEVEAGADELLRYFGDERIRTVRIAVNAPQREN